MSSKNLEFKVGLFVFIGIAILGVSLYWLEGFHLRNNTRTYSVHFADAGMLKVGNIATVSGIFKGKVTDMRLDGNGVLARIKLSSDVALKKDAQFIIRNYGIMGERFVAIYPGEDAEMMDTTTIAIGRHDSGMPEVMGLMGEMVNELHDLVISFRKTIGSDSTLSRFNRSISNFENVSSSLASYIDRSESKLDNTADNFLAASKELRSMLSDNSGRVDSTLQRMDRVSAGLDEFVIRLDTLATAANLFAEKLNNPDGSLQMLLEDQRLYNDLRKTADDIDDLINDIRANPRKYINLKVELF